MPLEGSPPQAEIWRAAIEDVAGEFLDLAPPLTSEEQATSEQFIRDLSGATPLVRYEGLPSSWDDSERYQDEAARVDVLTIAHQAFYPWQLSLKAEERERIAAAFSPLTLTRRSGLGFCGCCSFHADHALTWKVGERLMAVLVCFGCHQLHFAVDGRVYPFEVGLQTQAQLEAILREISPPRAYFSRADRRQFLPATDSWESLRKRFTPALPLERAQPVPFEDAQNIGSGTGLRRN